MYDTNLIINFDVLISFKTNLENSKSFVVINFDFLF
jgi:hypothetical protein